jgi:hypothetical protein
MGKKTKPAPEREEGKDECDEGDFPCDFPSLSLEEITRLGEELLNKKTPLDRKESILLELAHNGCWEALKPLEEYVRDPDKELWAFAELAFEECRGWFQEDPYGRGPDEQVYMGFDRDKPCPCGSNKLYRECHGTLPLGPPTWESKLDDR